MESTFFYLAHPKGTGGTGLKWYQVLIHIWDNYIPYCFRKVSSFFPKIITLKGQSSLVSNELKFLPWQQYPNEDTGASSNRLIIEEGYDMQVQKYLFSSGNL